jgi:hypothetical protein
VADALAQEAWENFSFDSDELAAYRAERSK